MVQSNTGTLPASGHTGGSRKPCQTTPSSAPNAARKSPLTRQSASNAVLGVSTADLSGASAARATSRLTHGSRLLPTPSVPCPVFPARPGKDLTAGARTARPANPYRLRARAACPQSTAPIRPYARHPFRTTWKPWLRDAGCRGARYTATTRRTAGRAALARNSRPSGWSSWPV